MQILISISESLSAFYHENRSKKKFTTDILCFFCNKADCLRFHQYYYRQIVDENSTYYKHFPIPRFICKVVKKTISLLPSELVPYRKYSLGFILSFLLALSGRTVEELLDECHQKLKISSNTKSGFDYHLSEKSISRFWRSIIGAARKLDLSKEFDFVRRNESKEANQYLLKYLRGYSSPISGPFNQQSGIGAISYDFYIRSHPNILLFGNFQKS